MKEGIRIAVVGKTDRTRNYMNALRSLGVEVICAAKSSDAEGCNGLILPGGGDISPALYGEEICGSDGNGMDEELDRIQLEAADYFARHKKPILGICKGMQLLNIYFGGNLYQNIENAAMHAQKNGVDQAHDTSIERGSFLYTIYGDSAFVNSAHHQAIKRLGEGFKVVQTSEDGLFEGISHEKLPILGVQWHPERMCFAHRRSDTVNGSELIRYFADMVIRKNG